MFNFYDSNIKTDSVKVNGSKANSIKTVNERAILIYGI